MTSSKNFDIFQCSKRKKQDAHVRIINHVAVTPTTQCLLATDKRPAEAHKKSDEHTELIGNCPQLPSTHTRTQADSLCKNNYIQDALTSSMGCFLLI